MIVSLVGSTSINVWMYGSAKCECIAMHRLAGSNRSELHPCSMKTLHLILLSASSHANTHPLVLLGWGLMLNLDTTHSSCTVGTRPRSRKSVRYHRQYLNITHTNALLQPVLWHLPYSFRQCLGESRHKQPGGSRVRAMNCLLPDQPSKIWAALRSHGTRTVERASSCAGSQSTCK
eukprot:611668-Amphidinium_carterae.1